MTNRGFYSIVEKKWDAEDGTLTVRARRRYDIEEFLYVMGDLLGAGDHGYSIQDSIYKGVKQAREEFAAADSEFIEHDLNADYAWRLRANREWVTAAIDQLVADIDYSNFKDSVHQNGLDDHHAAYSSVWGVMQRLQPRPALTPPVGAHRALMELFKNEPEFTGDDPAKPTKPLEASYEEEECPYCGGDDPEFDDSGCPECLPHLDWSSPPKKGEDKENG